MNRSTPLAALLLACIAGCGPDAPEPAATTAQPATLPGVYSGDFPCSNCPAIAATLWLRDDGRFFLRQRFAAAEGSSGAAGETTYALGRWEWDEHAAEAVLRGAGPARRVVVHDADRIELIVPSTAEHVMTRAHDAPPFTDRLTLDGESAVSDGGATFTECLTGLALEVVDAGAYRELRRQHRRINARGKVALTTVEGHIVTTSADSGPRERLVVDRYVTMKPGTPCPAR